MQQISSNRHSFKNRPRIQTFFRVLLGLSLLYAGIGHLTFLRIEFLAQVPRIIPINPDLVVVLSGLLEICLGLSLLFARKYKAQVGLFTAFFFVLIFPGNIAQYLNGIDAFGLDSDRARFIRLFFQPVLIAWALWSTGAWSNLGQESTKQKILRLLYPCIRLLTMKGDFGKDLQNKKQVEPVTSFYDLDYTLANGQKESFAKYKGRKILIANTASDCGYTGQYAELQALKDQWGDEIAIIGFPSNDFKEQEKKGNDEIVAFCQINYGVDFPIAQKSHVIKSEKQSLVFQWLSQKEHNGWNETAPVWNFSKYLIDERGVLQSYYGPSISPSEIKIH